MLNHPAAVLAMGFGLMVAGIFFAFMMGQVFWSHYLKTSIEEFQMGLKEGLKGSALRVNRVGVCLILGELQESIEALVKANSKYKDELIRDASKKLIDETLRLIERWAEDNSYDEAEALRVLRSTWENHCRIVYQNRTKVPKGILPVTDALLQEYENRAQARSYS